MKLVQAILITAALVTPTTAIAGTVVTNSTVNRNSYGHGTSEFSSIRNSAGSQDNFSQSIKAEALGDFANSSVTLKDGKLSGGATASTNRPVDPIAIITNATQSEKLTFTQSDVGRGYETYQFNGNEYSHSVSSDSTF